MYQPSDARKTDVGWWKVSVIASANVRRTCTGYVHPGTLAHITGEVWAYGNAMNNGSNQSWWNTEENMMEGYLSCHCMGEVRAPEKEECEHTGWCRCCQERMASKDTYRATFVRAISQLRFLGRMRCDCKRGKHRSLTIAVLLWRLTSCTGSYAQARKRCNSGRLRGLLQPCEPCTADDCATVLLSSPDTGIQWIQSICAGGAPQARTSVNQSDAAEY